MMSRLLQGTELGEAIKWMDVGIEEAQKSPCVRDKRGVIIVRECELLGIGHNAPPEGYRCEPFYCEPTCRTYAVHAEMNAIIDAVRRQNNLIGSRMYHARVEGGELVSSRKPRCADCSKHLLGFGIAEFVLKHEEGMTLYPIRELHQLSLDSMRHRE